MPELEHLQMNRMSRPVKPANMLITWAIGWTLLLWFASPLHAEALLTPKAGFQELEPIHFSFQQKGKPTLRLASSRARIFYSFQPADQPAERQPTFIFFNGGPGCATSNGLMAWNTKPQSLDPLQFNPIGPNPDSWTALGNTLHIDAPVTGFSYNLLNRPAAKVSRAQLQREFTAKNFNPYIDAAQLLRVVLRVLADYPALSRNPVILVGESYGGVRTTLMLDFLLHYSDYDGRQVYRDPALVQEVGAFLQTVLGDRRADPATIAQQFGYQLLIQPLLTGEHQLNITGALFEAPGSVIHQLAWNYQTCAEQRLDPKRCNPEENALAYVKQAGRNPYQLNWLIGSETYLLLAVDLRLLDYPTLGALLAFDPALIQDLASGQRALAYKSPTRQADLEKLMQSRKFATLPFTQQMMVLEEYQLANSRSPTPPVTSDSLVDYQLQGPTLEAQLGRLNRWDAYFTSCNQAAFEAFYDNAALRAQYPVSPVATGYGALFLKNLPYVHVFMTHAAQDLVIYPGAIAPSFLRYPEQVAGVSVERPCPDQACDGTIQVQLKAGPDLPAPVTRAIRYPYYPDSGHMVTWTMPGKLLKDVRDWLKQATEEP